MAIFPKRETLNVMRMDENFHETGQFTKELQRSPLLKMVM